jgi:hypothetical protein
MERIGGTVRFERLRGRHTRIAGEPMVSNQNHD